MQDMLNNLSSAVGCYIVGLLDCHTEHVDDDMIPYVFKINSKSSDLKRQGNLILINGRLSEDDQIFS